MKNMNVTLPEQNFTTSILAEYDAEYSQGASIDLKAFHEGNYIVGQWTVNKGAITKQNRFKMIDDPKRKYSKATIENAMIIMCMEAVREAMEMGGFKIELNYSYFDTLNQIARGECIGKPGDDAKCALCTFLEWAINNGARFVLMPICTVLG